MCVFVSPLYQFETVDTLLGTMKKLPPAVFMVADLTEDEKKMVDGDKGERIFKFRIYFYHLCCSFFM